jgi:putative solute:sodium symporter small subunit
MAEIVLGLLAIGVAAAIASGLTVGLVPFPLGNGAVVSAALIGGVLIVRGLYRLARRRHEGRDFELRSEGLAAAIAGTATVVALTIPSLSETLNLATIAGFPLGLYAMGQGTLILFVALLFIYAVRQNRIDAGDP